MWSNMKGNAQWQFSTKWYSFHFPRIPRDSRGLKRSKIVREFESVWFNAIIQPDLIKVEKTVKKLSIFCRFLQNFAIFSTLFKYVQIFKFKISHAILLLLRRLPPRSSEGLDSGQFSIRFRNLGWKVSVHCVNFK